MTFHKINIEDLNINPFNSIGKEWMLITAGQERVNTMTASWGGVGVLWGENIVTAYIRPQRYTKEFVDDEDCFSLSFFDGQYKKELGILGAISGRDTNKIEDVNFHTTFLEGVPTFEEASLVFIVEKIYKDDIKPEFFKETSLDKKWYPQKDYHTFYIAKIKNIYINK